MSAKVVPSKAVNLNKMYHSADFDPATEKYTIRGSFNKIRHAYNFSEGAYVIQTYEDPHSGKLLFGAMAGGAIVGLIVSSIFGIPGVFVGGLVGGLIGKQIVKTNWRKYLSPPRAGLKTDIGSPDTITAR